MNVALAAAMTGMVASTLQQTLLATATPTIVGELGGRSAYAWVSGLYLAASTLVLPFAGAVTDRVGARPMYVTGMGVFAAGTAGACVSGSMGWLLVCRLVQGAGAGLLVPAALAVVGSLEGDRARGRAFGLMGMAQVFANTAGPMLGGWFTDTVGWRWGMAATGPLVVAGLVLAAASMPSTDHPRGWWRLRRADLQLPGRSSPESRLLAMSFVVGGLTLAVVTYLPWALQTRHHLDATTIGRRLVPMLLASAVGSAIGGALASRRRVLTGCWVVILAGLAIAARGDGAALTVSAAGVGLGCGAALPVLLTRVQAHALPGRVAAASSMVQLARHGGAAVLVPATGLWLVLDDPSVAGRGLLATLVLLASVGLVLATVPRTERPGPSTRLPHPPQPRHQPVATSTTSGRNS